MAAILRRGNISGAGSKVEQDDAVGIG